MASRAYGRFHRDARLILVTSLVTGAAVSLWWIDFNLYLVSLGYTAATIGLVLHYGKQRYLDEARPLREILERTGLGVPFGAGASRWHVA